VHCFHDFDEHNRAESGDGTVNLAENKNENKPRNHVTGLSNMLPTALQKAANEFSDVGSGIAVSFCIYRHRKTAKLENFPN
jgi:hypothetical protein